jgi:hypothetical protein
VSERASEPSGTVSERASEPSGTVSEHARSEQRPLLRVVRGSPSDEELAALVAVLTAAAGPDAIRPVPRSNWSDRSALLRRPLRPGPTAWRASALPVRFESG